LDKKKIIELRAKGQSLQATAIVGKEGITDSVLDEVVRQLEKRKLIKVRLLPASGADRKEVAKELATKSGSILIEVRGRTVLLAKDQPS
jgi:RNA-binding protein